MGRAASRHAADDARRALRVSGPFRKVIVNTATPERRTFFWAEHLRTFFDPGAGLTADQRAFVVETIPLLADLFASPVADAQTKMLSLENRMRGLFTRPQCIAMFGMVGPPEPSEGLPLPAGTRLTPVQLIVDGLFSVAGGALAYRFGPAFWKALFEAVAETR